MMNLLRLISTLTLLLFLCSACSLRSISSYKNIPYLPKNDSLHIQQQQLTIFTPKKQEQARNVWIFIHGGNWNSGSKSQYGFIGRRMARKQVVTVIIDYPLSPLANYQQMASSAASAVKWVKENIERYGGNPDRIFVSGHSAGGHLAALISIQKEYFGTINSENPIRGCILLDAAGLDMYRYLTEENLAKEHTFLQTFSANPAIWKQASPLYHLHPNMPPFLIYRGEKTYPSIIKSTERFVTELSAYQPKPNYFIVDGKKHIPMITQFFWTWNPLYAGIIKFMQE